MITEDQWSDRRMDSPQTSRSRLPFGFFELSVSPCDNSSPMGGTMHTRFLVVLTCVFAFGLSSLATTKKTAGKAAAGPLPDKAYLQKIWDGWGTLNPSRVAEFYAQGDHTFFDVTPLKYGS